MFWKKKSPPEKKDERPAQLETKSMRYYEHDGALRAYANRAMMLAFLCVPTTFIAVALAAYVRLQPPVVFRVDANGNATVVGPHRTAALGASLIQSAGAEPTDFDKKAFMRMFLERYLNFAADSVGSSWAEALNMMSTNLRRGILNAMEKDNTVGRIQDEQITSVFHLRSIEPVPNEPFSYIAYGVKEIHRVADHHETNTKLVGKYHIRLINERRTEENPSGLLIADYGEELLEADKQDTIAQSASFAGTK